MIEVAFMFAMSVSHGELDSREVVKASDILAEIERGDLVEYDDIIVEDNLDLRCLTLKTVHFNNTIFQGSVDFGGTNFSGDIWFIDANFSRDATFPGAKFSGGDADFIDAEFSGDADFIEAEFSGGDAHFSNATFSGGDAYFWNAEFSGGDADFMDAKFSGDADFIEAEFSGGDTDFRRTEFSGGKARFVGAEFLGGDASFKEAKFSGDDANFFDAKFSGGDAYFFDAEFSGGNAIFSQVLFSGGNANFENSIFGNTNQDESFNISLDCVRFDHDAYFENAIFHPNTKLDLTRSSYKWMFLPWSSINQNQASASDEDAYLALMRNYMNLGWFEDANDCYYEYRNKRRINEPICIEKLTDTLEWLIYGYGVKPTHTVGWIAFLVLLFGLIFTNDAIFKKYIREEIQVIPEDQSTKDHKAVEIKTILREEERINYIVDPLLLSLTTFTSGLTSFLYPSIEYKVEKHTRLVILERLLGSVFLALLITAISKTWLIR